MERFLRASKTGDSTFHLEPKVQCSSNVFEIRFLSNPLPNATSKNDDNDDNHGKLIHFHSIEANKDRGSPLTPGCRRRPNENTWKIPLLTESHARHCYSRLRRCVIVVCCSFRSFLSVYSMISEHTGPSNETLVPNLLCSAHRLAPSSPAYSAAGGQRLNIYFCICFFNFHEIVSSSTFKLGDKYLMKTLGLPDG